MTRALGWWVVGYWMGLGSYFVIRLLGRRDRAAAPPYTIVASDWRAGVAPRTSETTFVAAGIRCNKCGLTSWNPMDVAERYCANCHVFHEDARRVEEFKT